MALLLLELVALTPLLLLLMLLLLEWTPLVLSNFDRSKFTGGDDPERYNMEK